jgi:GNAT superfamily N-acetyltransferase
MSSKPLSPMPVPVRVTRGEYAISTDKGLLDVSLVHEFLSRSYWSPGIPRAVVERGIAHSLCFGIYRDGAQVGFARVITDRASFAYLADVFVVEAHRSKGLGKWLIQTILEHEELRAMRRFMLATRDAHSLYEQFGFRAVADPARLMEIHNQNAYAALS